MAGKPGVWGIDLGQCALKALRLETSDGGVTATAFDYVEYPKILSQPDADPEQLIREALETFLSRNTLKGDQVAIGIPGQSGLARFVKLPPVEEKKINDIVKFEAKQQIPFPLDEVVWDYQKLGQGAVTDGFAMETEIGLFAMKRDMISRYLGHFTSVGVEVHLVQMTPLALCNYVSYDLLKKVGVPEGEAPAEALRGKKRCIVALDIGTDSSSLVITDGEKVIWQRPIPLGGNHFTKALSKDMKLTFAKAEHLKRNAAKSAELAKILRALKPVLTDYVNEVQRSLGFFTNTHRDAHVEYMMGLGSAFRLPGFQKFLSEKLSLEVRKPSKMDRLGGDSVVGATAFKENLLSFAVAYGLGLQALNLGRIETNLLPREIVVDRQIRAKKPWAAAAAAMLLLGTAVMTAGYAAQYSSVTDPAIQEAMKDSDSAISAASSQNSQIDSKKGEVESTKTDVKTIVAGQDEKLNWIELNEFISRNIPIPPKLVQGEDGRWELNLDRSTSQSNILGERQLREWAVDRGREAVADYWKRILGLLPADAPPPSPELLSHLPTVDLESVNSRYTTDLGAVFELAKKQIKVDTGLDLGNSMKKSDLENPPEGAGWVVELRGTTTHKGGRDFLKACLVELLANDLGNKIPGKADEAHPIKGKVSHVFLYNAWKNDYPGSQFIYINQSLADWLVANAGAVGATGDDGMMGGGGMGYNPQSEGGAFGAADGGMAGAANPLSQWQPLTANSRGMAFSGGGDDSGYTGSGGSLTPGMGGPPSGMMLGGSAGAGAGAGGGDAGGYGSPLGGAGTATSPFGPRSGGVGAGGFEGGVGSSLPYRPGTSSTRQSRRSQQLRYEFIVIFFWKEPTPTAPEVETPEGGTTTPYGGGSAIDV